MGCDRRAIKLYGDIDGPHSCGRVSVAVEGFGGVMAMIDGDGCSGKCDIVLVVVKLFQQ